jgi:hypothetical protein
MGAPLPLGFMLAVQHYEERHGKPRRGRPRKYGDTLLTMDPKRLGGHEPVGRRTKWSLGHRACLVLAVFDKVSEKGGTVRWAIGCLCNSWLEGYSTPETLRRRFNAARRDPKVRWSSRSGPRQQDFWSNFRPTIEADTHNTASALAA